MSGATVPPAPTGASMTAKVNAALEPCYIRALSLSGLIEEAAA